MGTYVEATESDNLDINLDDLPKVTLVPAGIYKMKLVVFDTPKKSVEKGTIGCNLQLQIVDTEFAGRKLFYNLNIPKPNSSDMSKGYFRSAMEGLGATGNFSILNDRDKLIGNFVNGRVTIKEWNGVKQNQIASFMIVSPDDIMDILRDN